MSDFTNEQRACVPFSDDLATVALGIASARRREEVLEHAEQCPACSAELAQLSLVADSLLELAPEVEPPLGFESRLARRLESKEAVRSAPRRRLRVLALAALIVVVLGVGLGVVVSRHPAPAPIQSALAHPAEASLTSHGQVVGNVILSDGKTPWMIMTIEKDWWSGRVTCEAVLAGGKVETIGTFSLTGGYGTWGAPLTAPIGDVRGARLIASNGVVLASALLLD
jgi:hypothetical protein